MSNSRAIATGTLFAADVAGLVAKVRRGSVKHRLLFLALAVALSNVQAATAESYPSRPITLIVPAAVGGPTDTIARILTSRMSATLGQTIVVEDNGAAGGSVAVGKAARAEPDGYTLSIGHVGTHVFNGAIYTLPYDLRTAFDPVAEIASNPQLIDGKKSLAANTLKELIAWMRANPDIALQGTAGAGSPAHISGVYFQRETGTKFILYPTRAAAPRCRRCCRDKSIS